MKYIIAILVCLMAMTAQDRYMITVDMPAQMKDTSAKAMRLFRKIDNKFGQIIVSSENSTKVSFIGTQADSARLHNWYKSLTDTTLKRMIKNRVKLNKIIEEDTP